MLRVPRTYGLIALFIVATADPAAATEAVGLHGPVAASPDAEIGLTPERLDPVGEEKRVLEVLDRVIALRGEDRIPEAVDAVREGLKEYPEHPALLRHAARLDHLAGRSKEAAETYRRLLRSAPDDARLRFELGLCLEDLGLSGGAEAAFKESLRLDPSYTAAIQSLATLYRRTGRIVAAIRYFEALLEADPSFQETHRVLGDLYLRSGRYDKAMAYYRKAVSLNPKDRFAAGRLAQLEQGPAAAIVRQERDRRRGEKAAASVQVVPAPFAPARMPRIRVGIVEEAFTVEFKCSGPFILRDLDGSLISMRPRPAGQGYVISPRGVSQIVVANAGEGITSLDLIGEGVLIETVLPESTITLFNVRTGKGYFWSGEQDRSYRGSLEVRRQGDLLTVVNSLSLEEYLYSVVPSEMPSSWPLESLSAQAIAARTEAVHKMRRHREHGFDLCAEVHCQAYTGVGRETPRTNAAVDGTRGRVLVDARGPIDAVYSSSCGGHTQENIFGDASPVSYLRGAGDFQEGAHGPFPLSDAGLEKWLKEKPAVYCGQEGVAPASHFRWTRAYTPAELTASLRPYAAVGRVTGIEVLSRSRSGHVRSLRVLGTHGEAVLEKELIIRRALGNLRSALFIVEAKRSADGRAERFYFHGGGWGHAVGLCQTGAAGMASLGIGHERILEHYFPGARLVEWSSGEGAASDR